MSNGWTSFLMEDVIPPRLRNSSSYTSLQPSKLKKSTSRLPISTIKKSSSKATLRSQTSRTSERSPLIDNSFIESEDQSSLPSSKASSTTDSSSPKPSLLARFKAHTRSPEVDNRIDPETGLTKGLANLIGAKWYQPPPEVARTSPLKDEFKADEIEDQNKVSEGRDTGSHLSYVDPLAVQLPLEVLEGVPEGYGIASSDLSLGEALRPLPVLCLNKFSKEVDIKSPEESLEEFPPRLPFHIRKLKLTPKKVGIDSGAPSLYSCESEVDDRVGLGINYWREEKSKTTAEPDFMRGLEANIPCEVSVRERAESISKAPFTAVVSYDLKPQPIWGTRTELEEEPTTTTKTRDSLDQINEFLEETYRAQSEGFIRSSSRPTIISSPLSEKTESLVRVSPSPSLHSIISFDASSTTTTTTDTAPFATPTFGRKQSLINFNTFNDTQGLRTPSSRRILPPTSSSGNKIVVEPFRVKQPGGSGSGFTPSKHNAVSALAYGHKITSVPTTASPKIIKRGQRGSLNKPRGPLYFTFEEREAISELVHQKEYNCGHDNCKECIDREYAYHENRAMPTSMAPEERQKIIANNRSLRNIKNELDKLAEEGAIDDDAYNVIMRSLPSEIALGSSNVRASAVSPSPARIEPPPPSYGTPSLPTRTPSAAPTKPVIGRAIARFSFNNPGDCCFEPGDEIQIHAFSNADWSRGRCVRNGSEGLFPNNHVEVQAENSNNGYGNEKQGAYGGYPAQQVQGPPLPGPSNPYNSAVPPMQMANQPTEGQPGKGSEMGKKFGKKLGNAAIFGAGATIGGNIVNSIF